MAFSGLRVGTGVGACVLAAAVPAPALPQRLQTSSGGFIPARRLKLNHTGKQWPQRTCSTRSGSHSLAFSEDPFLWKAGISSH